MTCVGYIIHSPRRPQVPDRSSQTFAILIFSIHYQYDAGPRHALRGGNVPHIHWLMLVRIRAQYTTSLNSCVQTTLNNLISRPHAV